MVALKMKYERTTVNADARNKKRLVLIAPHAGRREAESARPDSAHVEKDKEGRYDCGIEETPAD
jgi:hypothetical protein